MWTIRQMPRTSKLYPTEYTSHPWRPHRHHTANSTICMLPVQKHQDQMAGMGQWSRYNFFREKASLKSSKYRVMVRARLYYIDLFTFSVSFVAREGNRYRLEAGWWRNQVHIAGGHQSYYTCIQLGNGRIESHYNSAACQVPENIREMFMVWCGMRYDQTSWKWIYHETNRC